MRSIGLLTLTAALTLAACGKKEEAPVAAASSEAAPASTAAAATTMAGEYAVTDAAGKPVLTSTINADGTYRDVPVKGLPIAGTWKSSDGKTCFDPSGSAPEECFTTSAPGADGSFTATGADGTVLTIKPVKK